MKYLYQLFICLVVMLFSLSCTHEEIITTVNSENPLIGQWKATEVNTINTLNIYYNGVFMDKQIAYGEGIDLSLYFDIEENPNDLISSGSYGIDYSSDNENYTIKGIHLFNAALWQMNGDSLIVRSGDQWIAFFVEELNSNSMKLTVDEDLHTVRWGYDYFENAKVNYTFTKIK
ncbi:hypothetical protein [Marinigracilibium pacificum]|uniref:Lipocalin-like protein n=1 Tax=Marinigracilibium pacificum TaxID=2729599 RepID=A0A848J431_9BACT|nr:hypothetical protein [Marinigracilibium pacificum]NMM50265.1 hypothetical protein [Marinigracilibium pacificum]